MNDTRYKPDEIPDSVTMDMVVWYQIAGYDAGRIGAYFFDFQDNAEKVLLCKQAVTFKLPKIDRDGLKSKALEMLQAEKQKILAENHTRLQAIQDKIDNLLALEYQPSEAA